MLGMVAAAVRVNCVVTSPPYWGLRDYGVPGQLGLEPTPEQYVANLVEVFGLVRELLADDGTLWLNLGDSYANDGKWGGETGGKQHYLGEANRQLVGREKRHTGLKPKDLVGIPWRVAFALQADGWYLRQDIIWAKPNPMPESVRDRCTKNHEYLFLLAKSERYYYDANAIAEPCGDAFSTDPRHGTGGTERNEKEGYERAGAQNPKGPHRVFGKHSKTAANASGRRMTENVAAARVAGNSHDAPFGLTRNKRSVWTVTTKPFAGAHFATFPPDLIEPCILAGCPSGGIVLDPFMGSGITAEVAQRLGRQWVGCELNPAYESLQRDRARQTGMVF